MTKRNYRVWVMTAAQTSPFTLQFLTSYADEDRAITRARHEVAHASRNGLGAVVRAVATRPDGQSVARFERAGFFGRNADRRYEPVELETP
jgi:hypothetical protein